VAAQKRANRAREVVRKAIEDGLGIPVADVRVALRAQDDAAVAALKRSA
jgi:hypothetical protein